MYSRLSKTGSTIHQLHCCFIVGSAPQLSRFATGGILLAAQEEQVVYELRHVARLTWQLETRAPSFSLKLTFCDVQCDKQQREHHKTSLPWMQSCDFCGFESSEHLSIWLTMANQKCSALSKAPKACHVSCSHFFVSPQWFSKMNRNRYSFTIEITYTTVSERSECRIMCVYAHCVEYTPI